MSKHTENTIGVFLPALLNAYSSTIRAYEKTDYPDDATKTAMGDSLEEDITTLAKGHALTEDDAQYFHHLALRYATTTASERQIIQTYLEALGVKTELLDKHVETMAYGVQEGIFPLDEGYAQTVYEEACKSVDPNAQQTITNISHSNREENTDTSEESADTAVSPSPPPAEWEPIYAITTVEGQVEAVYRYLIEGRTKEEVKNSFDIPSDSALRRLKDHLPVIETIYDLTKISNAEQMLLPGKRRQFENKLENLPLFEEINNVEGSIPHAAKPYSL